MDVARMLGKVVAFKIRNSTGTTLEVIVEPWGMTIPGEPEDAVIVETEASARWEQHVGLETVTLYFEEFPDVDVFDSGRRLLWSSYREE